MSTLLAMFVGAGLLLTAISVPLVLRKIGPNPVYGFCVKQTLENTEIWYEVNEVAGRGLFVDGLVVVVAALVMACVPGLTLDRYANSVTILFFLALSITLITSVRHLGQVVRRRAETGE